jgi:hypothetical protein
MKTNKAKVGIAIALLAIILVAASIGTFKGGVQNYRFFIYSDKEEREIETRLLQVAERERYYYAHTKQEDIPSIRVVQGLDPRDYPYINVTGLTVQDVAGLREANERAEPLLHKLLGVKPRK